MERMRTVGGILARARRLVKYLSAVYTCDREPHVSFAVNSEIYYFVIDRYSERHGEF
jgi:hypothetical protein